MKIVQLNLWGGRLEPQISSFIKNEDPDILCLQEAIELEGGKGALFITIEELAEILDTKHHYMSPVFTFSYMSRRANFGNCIISKFPIKAKATIFTGKEYIADFDLLTHIPNMRNLQYAEVLLPDSTSLHVFNHHGHHNYQHKNGDSETMRQCKIIAERIAEKSGKVILSGDFNLSPNSKSLGEINKLLINQSIQAKLKTTRNNLTHKKEACDYIFTSSAIQVSGFQASNEIVSDHQALVMEFN